MYNKILLALDGSPTADKVRAEVINVAALSATIRVMYTMENPIPGLTALYGEYHDVEPLREALVAEGHKLLAQAKARLSKQCLNVQTRLPKAIKTESDTWPASLTILGTQGRRGVRRLLRGNVAEHFMRISEGPLRLVRRGEPSSVSAHRSAARLQPAPQPEMEHA